MLTLHDRTIASLKVYAESQKPITWSMVEIHVGVIAACIPTYTPLLRQVRGKLTTGFSGDGSHGRKASGTGAGRGTISSTRKTKSGKSAGTEDEIALCDAPTHGGIYASRQVHVERWVEPREAEEGSGMPNSIRSGNFANASVGKTRVQELVARL